MTQASTLNPAALGLVDGPSDAGLDDVADLVVETLHVPVALVSLVLNEEERQYFASRRGLPDSICETPISHSFCRHVKAADAPLVVANALQHPLVRNNPAITSLNVVAYLGMPIHDPKGRPIGALCAIDHVPREWGEADLSILSRLARLVTAQIRNRSVDMTERKTRSEIEEILERRARFFERVTHELRTPLNGVTGLLDVMQPDDLSDPELRRPVQGGVRQHGRCREPAHRLRRGAAGPRAPSRRAFRVCARWSPTTTGRTASSWSGCCHP